MNCVQYHQTVVKISVDSDGESVVKVEARDVTDPDFNLDERNFHVRTSGDTLKIWLGALQGPMVVQSLVGTLLRNNVTYEITSEKRFFERVITELLDVCFQVIS